MRKYIYMLAAGIIACVPAHAQKYTVTGTAEGTEEGDMVFLCKAQAMALSTPTLLSYVTASSPSRVTCLPKATPYGMSAPPMREKLRDCVWLR